MRHGPDAFALSCEAAAITHGHPSGYYSAGCFASVIRTLTEGRTLPEAIDRALRILCDARNSGHEECSTAIRQAVALWRDVDVAPSPEVIERMGGGWVGEQALAIALYCALSAQDDFLGLILGLEAIPARWLDGIELRAEIEILAGDLHTGFDESDVWSSRYPGW